MAIDGQIQDEAEGVGGGIHALAGGSGAHLPALEGTPIPVEGIVSRRGDALGFTQAIKREILEARLVGTLYLGLFVDQPDRAGLGGVELTWAGYARQPVDAWVTTLLGASVARRNSVSIVWPVAPAVTVTAIGWGLWDAVTDGELICHGFLRSVSSAKPLAATFNPGEQPAVGSGQIGVVIQ